MRSHGFSRLQNWGWVVATGISAEDADSGLYGVLGAVGAGLLASLALAAFVAWYFSRDVIEPIEALKGAASALGRGETVRAGPWASPNWRTWARRWSLPRPNATGRQESAGPLLAAAAEGLRRAEAAAARTSSSPCWGTSCAIPSRPWRPRCCT